MRALYSSLAMLVLFPVGRGFSQTEVGAVETEPVGFVSISLPVGSDTIVAAPLTRAPVHQGVAAGNSGLQISVADGGLGDFHTTPHYLQPVTGSQAGLIFDVQTNTPDSITVFDNGVAPSGFTNGVQFKVVPYWTLGTLFPPKDQGVSFTPSLNATGIGRRTQILFPDVAGSGINRAPTRTYYFLTNSGWRNPATGTNSADNTPILPDSYFIVRNPTNATAGLKLTVEGTVHTGPMAVQLDRLATGKNDNYVSLGRATDIPLNELGLISSGAFKPSSSTLPTGRGDELLVFGPEQTGFNKAPIALYYYLSNGTTQAWRSSSTGTNDVGGHILPAGGGYIIRKAAAAPGGSQFWTNNSTIAP